MYSDGQSVNQSVIRSLSLSAILIVIENTPKKYRIKTKRQRTLENSEVELCCLSMDCELRHSRRNVRIKVNDVYTKAAK